MAHQKSEEERIANDRNVPRFCVENRQITWVLMAGVILVGGVWLLPDAQAQRSKVRSDARGRGLPLARRSGR